MPSATGCEASGSGEAEKSPEHASSAVATGPTVDLARRASDDARARADLAADVRHRTEAARRTYGDGVPLRVESDLFVLFRAEEGARFDEAADLAQRGLDAYLGSFFSRRPDRAVTVYVVRSATAFVQLCAATPPRRAAFGSGRPRQRWATVLASTTRA
jgi:hypothetical protein